MTGGFSTPPPENIWKDLGPTVRETVLIGDQAFHILRPKESDRLLDHPAVLSAHQRDEYMPYWADLWPAARMLAKVLWRENIPQGLEALEIGCGLGLPGIVALARGLQVTFSDYDACALRFAADNARLNGFEAFRTLQLDWRRPPPGLIFPLILGADLIYEVRNVAPLVAFIKQILLPGALCLLTDQDRVPSGVLRETLQAEGLSFTTQLVRAGEPGRPRLKGTLYRIRK